MEVLRAEAQKLMDQGADAASPAMQTILNQHDELLLRYGMRERSLRQLAWNAQATEKWLSIGIKVRRLAGDGQGAKLADFWAAAISKRPQYLAVQAVMLQIRDLMESQTDAAGLEIVRTGPAT